MTATARPAPEYPFSPQTRAADRDRILIDIVASVWDSMLGLPILVRDGQEDLDHGDIHTLTGTVHVTGAWQGTLAMATPIVLATECAARMYDQPAGSLPLTEVQDAWGELCNMVAGNVKACLPPPCQISLPGVVEGTTYSYRVGRTRVLNELTFACLGKRIRLTVLQREDAA
jgi:CheY-specific phosphatase CheX